FSWVPSRSIGQWYTRRILSSTPLSMKYGKCRQVVVYVTYSNGSATSPRQPRSSTRRGRRPRHGPARRGESLRGERDPPRIRRGHPGSGANLQEDVLSRLQQQGGRLARA